MSRFLVTGGAGFVGSHLVKHLLQRGHDVSVFDNLLSGHRDAVGPAQLIEGDLASPQALVRTLGAQRFDAVMHFAALWDVSESVRKPAEYYRNNVVGSLELISAMRGAGLDRLVLSSTCATYGDPVSIPISEEHPQRPVSPYGESKLMVERMLRDHATAYGFSSVALRYFNAAGSDSDGQLGERHCPETHLIPRVLAEAKRVRGGGDPAATTLRVFGADYATEDGTCVRDYVHVEDLAAAHLAAAERMISGQFCGFRAYNLGIGCGFSVLEVIDSCRRVTGVPIEYRVAPRREGDPPRLVADSRAARRDLAWEPRYTELDGIVRTAWRWFSQH